MLVAIAYHFGDLDQARSLAGWLRELGPYPNHDILVARDSSTEDRPFYESGFRRYEEIIIRQTDVYKKWPQSCNNAFSKIAKHIQFTRPEPWLWIEPDCVPIARGWLDLIAGEYLAGGKPFLGDFIPGIEGGPDHMSGIGVYPPNLAEAGAGVATLADEHPWDLLSGPEIVPRMVRSRFIQHVWKRPVFANVEEIRATLRPETVLILHSDKAGSIIQLLSKGKREESGVCLHTQNPDLEGSIPSPCAIPEPPPPKPPPNYARKLTAEDVTEVRRLYADTPATQAQLAEQFDVTQSLICKVLLPEDVQAHEVHTPNPRLWQGTGKWQYKEKALERLALLISEIKAYCDHPAHIELVRQELVHQRVLMPKHIRPWPKMKRYAKLSQKRRGPLTK